MATLFNDIELDDGDLGLIFIPGVGFRPVDGIDHYGSNKLDTPECPVTAVYKDIANDRVVVERECDPAPLGSGGATRLAENSNDGSTFTSFYEDHYTSVVTSGSSTTTTTPITFETPPTFDVDCCDTFITVTEEVPPPEMEIPSVPVWDSFPLLLTALFMLGLLKGKLS